MNFSLHKSFKPWLGWICLFVYACTLVMMQSDLNHCERIRKGIDKIRVIGPIGVEGDDQQLVLITETGYLFKRPLSEAFQRTEENSTLNYKVMLGDVQPVRAISEVWPNAPFAQERLFSNYTNKFYVLNTKDGNSYLAVFAGDSKNRRQMCEHALMFGDTSRGAKMVKQCPVRMETVPELFVSVDGFGGLFFDECNRRSICRSNYVVLETTSGSLPWTYSDASYEQCEKYCIDVTHNHQRPLTGLYLKHVNVLVLVWADNKVTLVQSPNLNDQDAPAGLDIPLEQFVDCGVTQAKANIFGDAANWLGNMLASIFSGLLTLLGVCYCCGCCCCILYIWRQRDIKQKKQEALFEAHLAEQGLTLDDLKQRRDLYDGQLGLDGFYEQFIEPPVKHIKQEYLGYPEPPPKKKGYFMTGIDYLRKGKKNKKKKKLKKEMEKEVEKRKQKEMEKKREKDKNKKKKGDKKDQEKKRVQKREKESSSLSSPVSSVLSTDDRHNKRTHTADYNYNYTNYTNYNSPESYSTSPRNGHAKKNAKDKLMDKKNKIDAAKGKAKKMAKKTEEVAKPKKAAEKRTIPEDEDEPIEDDEEIDEVEEDEEEEEDS